MDLECLVYNHFVVVEINGIKFLLGPCRWLLIRSSETEDIIRFYAEGQSEKETEMLLSCGREILGI